MSVSVIRAVVACLQDVCEHGSGDVLSNLDIRKCADGADNSDMSNVLRNNFSYFSLSVTESFFSGRDHRPDC